MERLPTRLWPSARIGLTVWLAVATTGDTALAQHAGDHDGDELGAVHFPVSCAPGVQADFDRAVALLHHMMYVESRAAFIAIAEADPECAMAHWGIPTTLFQPLWPTRPGAAQLKRGREEIRRARELGPQTEREAAFVAAVEAFYRDAEADWWSRIAAWAGSMEAAYEAYSDDLEVAAFYALSHLAAGQTAEDRQAYQARAAEVLLAIYEQEATHPGAIHYTIHANDVDDRADQSLAVVRSYDDIAPSVPHALHMPTHIYVRLGDWPGVIEWNRKSADAALKFPAGDAVSHHYPHAMDYLVYAYLQQGEDAKALAAVEESLAKGKYQGTFISAFHLAAMPARYAVERRDWATAASLPPLTPADLPWDRYQWAEAQTWFAKGLGAVRSGDLEAAELALGRMEALRDAAADAGEAAYATNIDIDVRTLAAWVAMAKENSAGALSLARSAVELETTTQKDPVTPGSYLPPSEALGDLLLEIGNPTEALKAYEKSLAMWPGRFNSLLGAARSARAISDGSKATLYYDMLVETAPDSGREEVEEARSFLSQSSQQQR
jgi:tetratricopeptide (TPR) repeat protein